MNLNTRLIRRLRLAGGILLPALLISACGSNNTPDPAVTAQNQEIEQLRQENQDLAQVRAENQEVQRLKKENQDLAKLRSQYQEATRLTKENDQLLQQIAKISPAAAATNAPQAAAGPVSAGANVLSPGQVAPQLAADEKAKEAAEREAVLNEGDEIFVDPKALKAVVPEIDWEKLNRKDPLGIRSVLEKDGTQITNVQQLRDIGITNFTIRRAPPAAQPQAQPAPKNQ